MTVKFEFLVSKARILRALLSILLAISIAPACSDSGVQGSDSFSSFSGLESIEPLSPTGIRLGWQLDSIYSEYRIYQNGSASPTKTETFSQTVISGLTAGTQYSFIVNGVDSTGSEVLAGGTRTATTFSRFQGLKAGGVTVRSSTQVSLTWDQNASTATYLVFQKPEGGSYDTVNPTASVTNLNQYLASGLNPGETYCFYVIAEYADGTSEPSRVAADMDAKDHCQRLTSNLPDLPSISIHSVIPGELAWFVATGGNATYEIDVHELDSDINVASRTGPGTFRAFVPSLAGKKNYYALVTDGSQVARVPVEISTGDSPTAVQTRNLRSTVPFFPQIQAGGNGLQNMGETLVSGDFNCDGLPDIAVSAPLSTPLLSTNFYSQTGGVQIYYSDDPAPFIDGNGNVVDPPPQLNTSAAPTTSSTYPLPHLITYPAVGSQNYIGKTLAVGNVNGDCAYRKPNGSTERGECSSLMTTAPASDTHLIYQCDDLIIGTSYNSGGGRFFTVYGNDQLGLISGSGGASYGIDEATCDPAAGSCRAVAMSAGSTYNDGTVGASMTVGDFNNDGYADVAVSATRRDNGIQDVLIYRGSSLGLRPITDLKSHASIYSSGLSLATGLIDTDLVSEDLFGAALASVPNSRSCVNATPSTRVYRTVQPPFRKGYDETKCDDLIIGSPGRGSGRGSIVACRVATMDDSSSTDRQKILTWACLETYPVNVPDVDVLGYGSTLLGVSNQNGYPLQTLYNTTVPTTTGALFVGAPRSTVAGATNAGIVFGYYVTPQSASNSAGGIAGVLSNGNNIPQTHDIDALNEVPCDKWNANKFVGGLLFCNHQGITMAPAEGSAYFGRSLSSIPSQFQTAETFMPSLAVGAPGRSVLSRDGSRSITAAGTIYLYRPDLSTFGFEGSSPILSPQYNSSDTFSGSPTCTTQCTWYSGGVSPFGPTLVYPFDLNESSGLGSTASAGIYINDDNEVDLITSAPNFDVPSKGNGGLFGFLSDGGFGPSLNNVDLTVNYNSSFEGRYEFEQAKVVGDVNNDGYDDVMTHVNSNGKWQLLLFYGSSSGLIKTPAPSLIARGTEPLKITSSTDPNLGENFYPAGDVNGDGFADVYAVGRTGSYLFYGGSNGLVASTTASVAPVGKNPLLFGVSRFDSIPKVILNNFAVSPNLIPWNAGFDDGFNSAVVAGDFNKDGFSDIAIRLPRSTLMPAADVIAAAPEANFIAGNFGRVLIIYGSNLGLLTNRQNGAIYLQDTVGDPADVVIKEPCLPGYACKIQMLAEAASITPHGGAFGSALAVVRGRNVGESGPITKDAYDHLLISDPGVNSDSGAVFLYKGTSFGLGWEPVQTLVPQDLAGTADDDQRFGTALIELGDVNGDGYTDIAIAAPQFVAGDYLTSQANAQIYVFYGQQVEGQNAFFGAGTLASKNFWAPAVTRNTEMADPTLPRPQILRPENLVASTGAELLARYMTPLGDFNDDGYDDFLIVSPNGDQNSTGSLIDTGYAVVYFGGPKGIRVGGGSVASTNPRCFGGASPLCEPWQIFLPDSEELENLMVGPFSAGDINGDGLNDVVIGTVGRSHPSGNAFATGAIYVLY